MGTESELSLLQGGDTPSDHMRRDFEKDANMAWRRLVYLARCKTPPKAGNVNLGACNTILQHYRWRQEHRDKPYEVLLRMLNGDEAALEAWLRAKLSAIEAKKKGDAA